MLSDHIVPAYLIGSMVPTLMRFVQYSCFVYVACHHIDSVLNYTTPWDEYCKNDNNSIDRIDNNSKDVT